MPKSRSKQLLLNFPRPAKRGLVLLIDFLIVLFTVWLAFGLRLDQWGGFYGGQWWALIAAVSFSTPLFISFGLYRAIFRYVGSAALAEMVRAFVIYALLYFCFFTLIGIDDIPRSIGVIQPILLFILIVSSRYFIRYWLGGIEGTRGAYHQDRPAVLIYGAGSAGRQLAAGLLNKEEMLVKGFIDDDPRIHGNTVNGIAVYPSTDLLARIRKKGITDVLLAIPSVTQKRRREIITSLNGCGVRVRTVPGISEIAAGRARILDLQDLDMNDLLGRAVVLPEPGLLEQNIQNQVVLVTGAGGSIGSELCRQIVKYSPKVLILIDISEYSLYLIYEELKKDITGLGDDYLKKINLEPNYYVEKVLPIQLIPCMVSIRDEVSLLKIFKQHRPHIVFHAAAYKHVPLVEENPVEGIRNNVFGTLTCAQVSLECEVPYFVLVSTDKAVRPTNIMGASKRIAELILQAMADAAIKSNHWTNYSMVRFGNVLGSSGSVAPLFSTQIAAGGPITLTHLEVTRYFMTIPEAAQLVIQASAMAEGGDVFVLDMGEPVRIHDLAIKMIYLSGLMVKDEANPYGDIEIKVTGLRSGEKLYEELLIGENPQSTVHPKIMKANEDFLPWDQLREDLEKLNQVLHTANNQSIKKMLKKLVPGYQPNSH